MGLKQGLKKPLYTDSINVLAYSGISYVKTDCAVTQHVTPDLSVDVANGIVILNGTEVSIGSQTVAVTAASSGLYKHAIIRVDSTGTADVVYGTEDTTNGLQNSRALNVPDYDPDNYVALARILVGDVTTITNSEITDLRFFKDETTISVPIGAIIDWAKTFASADSGTTNGTTANKLVDSTQNFLTTVSVGYCVHNTTDDTFAYVTNVDSDTTLTLDADIMVSTDTYIIYKTPALDEHFVECNGQTISDVDSIFNGATAPDLNVTKRFTRGSTFSGTTGGSDTHTHKVIDYGGSAKVGILADSGSAGEGGYVGNSSGNSTPATKITANNFLGPDPVYTWSESSLSAYYEVVKIMRIK